MTSKKHFKLYKSGKQWCVAAIVTFAATLGLAAVSTANADTVAANNSVPQVQAEQGKDAVTTSQSNFDQGKINNTEDKILNTASKSTDPTNVTGHEDSQNQKETSGSSNGRTIKINGSSNATAVASS